MNDTLAEKDSQFDIILQNALKIPSVKVDRKKFLYGTLSNYIKDEQVVRLAIDNNTIEAGLDPKTLNKIAKSLINKRVTQTSATSFAAGIPGGLAMAATIPMDTLQFFAMALRIAQELAYIYGYEDLCEVDEDGEQGSKQEIILFLGTMFGVGGSAQAVRLLSSSVSKQALKKLPQKALTKTFYYPIIKNICKTVGIKVTKDSFAKSISKVIPIIGGVVSGGLTYVSMKPMCNRLNDTFMKAISNYNEEDIENDIEKLEKDSSEIVDVEYIEVDDIAISEEVDSESNNNISIADELIKYKELLNEGLITMNEFNVLKKKLLNLDDFKLESNYKKSDLELNDQSNKLEINTSTEEKNSIEEISNISCEIYDLIYKEYDSLPENLKNEIHFKGNDKSDAKIKKAVSTYVNLDKGEQIIFCFDNTVFGSAKDGLVFTSKGIHHKFTFEKWFIHHNEINEICINKEDKYIGILINKTKNICTSIIHKEDEKELFRIFIEKCVNYVKCD